MATKNLQGLFKRFDITESTALAREVISEKQAAYLAYQKKLEKIQDKPLAEVVSSLTGHKLSESYELTTSTNGHPQITLFPWFKGDVTYARDGGSAIRGFVDAFGLLRYQTLVWHYHEASFDPTMTRVPEILSVTQDGARWQFYSWQNGTFIFQPMTEQHIGLKTAKHRELDFMLLALEHKRPLGIVLWKEEWLAEFQVKIADRLEKTVKDVLKLREADFENARVANKMGQGPAPATKSAKKPAVVDGIDLDALTEPVTINVFSPRSTKPVTILFDPEAPDFATKVDNIRNAAPAYRFEKAE